jgi:acetyl-CoA synthetase
VDADGCWFPQGRPDESFNVAGRKVGPAEVEACLIGHTGERVVALAVLKPGAALTAASTDVSGELAAHGARSMGPTFRPRAIHVVPELPKTQSGKVVRRLIRLAHLRKPGGYLDSGESRGAGALQNLRRLPSLQYLDCERFRINVALLEICAIIRTSAPGERLWG